MSFDPDASPFNALPAAVVALSLVIFGVELTLSAGARGFIGGPEAVGWRLGAIRAFGFSESVFAWMVETGHTPPAQLLRFVAYPFVHLGFAHMLMALVFVLALGKMVAEAMGSLAVVAIFFASAMGGALVYALVLDTQVPLVGAYPAAYGLIGGFTFLLWTDLGRVGAPQYRAFTLISLLLAIQLVFGMLFGSDATWVAEIAGFATGFLLSFLVSPGGWTRAMTRLRQR